jgi:hypothetical protein
MKPELRYLILYSYFKNHNWVSCSNLFLFIKMCMCIKFDFYKYINIFNYILEA